MNNTQPVVAIVVAAGSGSRLGAEVPKALVELDGVTLIERCLRALADGGVSRAVVTVPVTHSQEFAEILSAPPLPVRLVVGGLRRQDSVRLGAEALSEEFADAVVLVHDAARPLVPAAVVADVARAVAGGADAVIPAVAVVDSIRELTSEGSRVVDRATLRAVQTPQGFPLATLLAAHRHLVRADLEVTDDAAAAEAIGASVTIVPGHRDAMKITEPVDMVLARAILAGRSQ
ncbi:2-C-methyl-D-erythritol 4-phosphate cytidylyltransferase [Tessaracoccus sp. OS52]|uniref:2-C-methyl-D-erythritol 4-phosphate cytidylyltransferase n=1 Tax=Tessaracoccus sp. OS52 TaxID=2886691 RepID=UPI001D11ED92|nr:2-C-methyl-D-erythritol 4-phosphate cytidylyltransferase [Tessaracoccus sp. OS52]MCC2591976.1 2-C-methyl-D-erythritol 4-phosphate cytidylyltransferase [Tessaracoccus sp. OS52]